MSDANTTRVTLQHVPLKSDESNLQAQPTANVDAWQVITLKPAIDSVNHADLVQEIHQALAEGAKRIALDLSQNRFFSLNAIQFCTSIARELSFAGGAFALVGCAERTRRHFDIYGSMKQIRSVRFVQDLVMETGVQVNVRSRTIFPEAR